MTPLPGQHQARLAIVDGLRAIAVVAVVLFHVFPATVPGGFIGVDVFFVISGFVIALRYLPELASRETTFTQFFARRVRRLVPAYFVLLLLVTPLAYAMLAPGDLFNFGQSLAAQAAYAQNVTFWLQGDYFDPASVKPLLHTWSLAVEEQFYLVFPLIVLLYRRSVKAALFALVLVSVVSYGLGAYFVPFSPKTPFFLLPTRVWEFCSGILAAEFYRRRHGRTFAAPVANIIFCLSIISIIAATLLFDETDRFPGPHAFLATIATVMICLVQGDISHTLARSLLNRVAQHLGRISYSWYLWHWPVVVFFFVAYRRLPTLSEGTLLLALGYILGLLSYRYVEAWGLSGSRQLAGNRAYGFLAIFLAATLSVGAFLTATNGALFRYPPAQRVLYAAQFDRAPFRCRYIARLQSFGEEICKLNGQPAGDGLLVLGDSHADQIKQAVADLGAAARRPVYLTKRNCKITDFGTTDFCSEAVWSEIAQAISQHRISAILFVSNWQPTDTAETFEKAVRRAKSTGASIYLEQALPNGAAFDPAARLRKPREGSKAAYGLGDYQRDYGSQNQALEEIAERQKVTLLRPTDYLCDPMGCDFSTRDYPNYSDTHHLTSVGVRRLEPMYKKLFASPDAAAK